MFSHAPCDVGLLHSWFNQLFPTKDSGGWLTGIPQHDDPSWRVLHKHICKAIRCSKNSMPGPDGVPALAYKKAEHLSAEILMGVLEVLSSPNAEELLVNAYKHMGSEEAHAFNHSILCCLPKKPSGEDEKGEKYYTPEATRPLNVSNMDNRIVTSAVRLAWEPMLERWISKIQRGFLRGRQMLHNVLDIDWQSMCISLKCERGSLSLFDFKAAFPSVSHEFLIACLVALGSPDHAIHLIISMYSCNVCKIKIAGSFFPGCAMLGGVRQGCPLSPLLFAVVVDVLLRMIQHRLPHSFSRAFADDIGTIITDWATDAPILAEIFKEFGSISNLHLNIGKTVCIPLWPKRLREIKNSISEALPSWNGIAISDKGTYLGFVLGPGKGTSSWNKPYEKYVDRVTRWRNLGCGLQFAVLSYNVFCISTLLFVGQLEPVPDWVSAGEVKQVCRMFPGPGVWLVAQDAWHFKEGFGLTRSAIALKDTVMAAQLRTAALGCHFGRNTLTPSGLFRAPDDNIWSRSQQLRTRQVESDYVYRIALWRDWYKGCFCDVLVNNLAHLDSRHGITPNKLMFTISKCGHEEWDDDMLKKVRRQLQSTCIKAIKNVTSCDPVNRIRDKTTRWWGIPFGLTGVPGIQARIIHRHLHELSDLVAPRVQAAVFKTLWYGWTTERRFQRRRGKNNLCKFMCNDTAEDSIEHYCRCPIVMKVAQSYLHVHYPPEEALNVWALNNYWIDRPEILTCIALLIYGVFNAYNSISHHGISCSAQAYNCITQHCKQGVLAHPASARILAFCWQRPLDALC